MAGMGEGPISWLSIVQYCNVQNIEGDLLDDMVYHIIEMDKAYLSFRSKQVKGQQNGR